MLGVVRGGEGFVVVVAVAVEAQGGGGGVEVEGVILGVVVGGLFIEGGDGVGVSVVAVVVRTCGGVVIVGVVLGGWTVDGGAVGFRRGGGIMLLMLRARLRREVVA